VRTNARFIVGLLHQRELQQQRALDHRKLSSETMVSTVSPSGVTWFGDSSNPALRSKEVQQLHLSNPTAVKIIGN
jgi:hypothetical protein